MRLILKAFLIALCLILSTIRVAGASVTVKNGLLRAQTYSYSVSQVKSTPSTSCIIAGDCKIAGHPAYPLLNPRILAVDTLSAEFLLKAANTDSYQLPYPPYKIGKLSSPYEAIDKPPQSFILS